MTGIEPAVGPGAEPFWEATRDHALVLPWCVACARAMWYPREVCPACLESNIEWRPATGTGTVYATTINYLPGPGRDASDVPYVVALIDLPEGVRMMSNVVNCAPAAVAVGMPVKVAWTPMSDGRNLPQFEPASSAESVRGDA